MGEEFCKGIGEAATNSFINTYGPKPKKQLDLNEECEDSIQFEDRYEDIYINRSKVLLYDNIL